MQEVFKEFFKLLKERLIENNVYSNEDSIRYTFYYSLLLTNKIKHYKVILEYPYSESSYEKLDTLIVSEPNIAIEFKFTKKIPSGFNKPRTQVAGSIFKDINKITTFNQDSALRRIFVFLTDLEMAKYLNSPVNGFVSFFNLQINNSIIIDSRFINTKAKTFYESVGKFTPVKLTCLFKEDLQHEYFLRIYEISPL